MKNNMNKDVLQLLKDTPVYHKSMEMADKHHEMSQYHLSIWLNMACADAMDDAIQRNLHEHPDEDFDPEVVLSEVLNDFSVDRVRNVLCNTVRAFGFSSEDEGFKSEDKEWAEMEVIPVKKPHRVSLEFLIHNRDLHVLPSIVSLFREKYDTFRFAETVEVLNELQQFFDENFWAFAILQLKDNEVTKNLRFCPLETLEGDGLTPNIADYTVVYKCVHDYINNKCLSRMSKPKMLECLFMIFNLEHPYDYHGRSMAVSDIVAIKRNKNISYYYVDSTGFVPLEGFV